MQIKIAAPCIILFFITLLFNNAAAQNITTRSTDFEKLQDKTEELSIVFPDSAIKSANLLLDFAKKSNSEELLAKALCTLAKANTKAAL